MKPLIVALDVGTSSCKAVAFEESGAPVAEGRGIYPIETLPGGRVEQDPRAILRGVREAVRALEEAGCELGTARAISLSAQIAAHCLVDAQGDPLTNVISWMDKRAEPQVETYNARFSPYDTERLTGMDMLITPAHTIARLRWMRENIPDLLERAARVAQVKDLLIHQLTGKWVTDPTSLKGIVDQKTGAPIPEIMDFTGCDARLLPKVRMPYEIAGALKPGVLGFEAFTPGIPVVTGWNDMNAAYLGMAGVTDECVGLDLTGTSEHMGIMLPKGIGNFRCDGINRVPFLEGREVFYGVTSTGGQALDWFVRGVLPPGDPDEAYRGLMDAAGRIVPEEMRGLLFLPYLMGERNPWNNPDARGVFFGLEAFHSRWHMGLAVLEGVCYTLRAISERLPWSPARMVVSGGASRNALWNQIKADVLNVRCEKLGTTEAGASGAAILAMKALEPNRQLGEIARGMTRTIQAFLPRSERAAYHEAKYQKFLRLYRTLTPLF